MRPGRTARIERQKRALVRHEDAARRADRELRDDVVDLHDGIAARLREKLGLDNWLAPLPGEPSS